MKIVISEMPPYFFDCDAPILHADEITDKLGRTLWRGWGEHCGKYHYHGPGFGHREAHCQGVARDCRLGHNTHADTVRRHPEARHAPTLPLPGRGYGAPLKGGIMALEFSDGQM